MRSIFTLGFAGWLVSLFGQAQLSVDRTEITIGDHIAVQLQLDLKENQQWINREQIWPDTLQGMEIISGPESVPAENGMTIFQWKLTSFDTGIVRIPSLSVILSDNRSIDTFSTIDIPVRVLAVEPDSSGLIPIKEIYREPFRLGYYKKYIPHLAILLLIMVGMWWWRKKRKRSTEITPIPVAEPSPKEWALEALDQLEKKKLWQRGEVKVHYSQLTDIFRGYLERRYQIHAMEQTTEEIIVQLDHVPLSLKTKQDINDLLSISDLVKFAKADPGIDIHSAAVDRIRAFVIETSPDGMVE